MRSFPPWTWDIPEYFNIAVACTDAHIGTPVADHAAVIVDDDAVGTQTLSFAQLSERTSRFAQVLRDAGARPGDRVLIRLPNCIEYSVAFLGAMKCGAVPVPTSILLSPEEFGYIATDSGAASLVVDRRSWTAVCDTLRRVPSLRVFVVGPGDIAPGGCGEVVDFTAALDAAGALEDPHLSRADDPAYLVYTSGSTGYPKGVLHAHRSLLGRQPASTYWFDFAPVPGDRVLHSGKYNWTYVLGTGLMDPLYRGHTAIVHEGSNAADVWPALIAKHRATIFIGVPTLYRHIVQHSDATGADVPTLRHCMCAGERLSEELLTAWQARFGLQIFEGLGMSECSYYICHTVSRPIRPGTAGFIQPGHDVKLLAPESGQEVGADEEGMLCIPRRDPALMISYWNRPDEHAASFQGDWFLTGDYARRDADGYISFLGRKDDLIKSSGYRVSPHEVERVLADHADVADVAVVGEAVTADKIVVAAYVIPKPGSSLQPADVLAYARERLASYKSPRVCYFVSDLPRTRNGKVLRRGLDPAQATTLARA